MRRRRPLAILAAAAFAAGALTALLVGSGPGRFAPFAGGGAGLRDPLAWASDRQADYERRAAAGLSAVLYLKSPGGAAATAERVARWRPLVERVAAAQRLDPDLLEALVFLESGGRADARAGTDLQGAVGLTQILAETARSLLGMRVDVARSAALTRAIARGDRVAAHERERRRVDQRFDPAQALAATGRYLAIARRALGRDDLALESYHMGIGNLQGALAAYGERSIPYARLFFDSTPLRNRAAWERLARLGDDSATYLWRLYAARDIMRLWRADPAALRARAALVRARGSADVLLQPPARTPTFRDAGAIAAALRSGALVALRPGPRSGWALDAAVPPPYRTLRPAAAALLSYLAAGVRDISRIAPLSVTAALEPQAPGRTYSPHATGFAFDVARRYRSPAQAQAFQFALDRLTALGLIAWTRTRATIHVTVAGDAGALLSR